MAMQQQALQLTQQQRAAMVASIKATITSAMRGCRGEAEVTKYTNNIEASAFSKAGGNPAQYQRLVAETLQRFVQAAAQQAQPQQGYLQPQYGGQQQQAALLHSAAPGMQQAQAQQQQQVYYGQALPAAAGGPRMVPQASADLAFEQFLGVFQDAPGAAQQQRQRSGGGLAALHQAVPGQSWQQQPGSQQRYVLPQQQQQQQAASYVTLQGQQPIPRGFSGLPQQQPQQQQPQPQQPYRIGSGVGAGGQVSSQQQAARNSAASEAALKAAALTPDERTRHWFSTLNQLQRRYSADLQELLSLVPKNQSAKHSSQEAKLHAFVTKVTGLLESLNAPRPAAYELAPRDIKPEAFAHLINMQRQCEGFVAQLKALRARQASMRGGQQAAAAAAAAPGAQAATPDEVVSRPSAPSPLGAVPSPGPGSAAAAAATPPIGVAPLIKPELPPAAVLPAEVPAAAAGDAGAAKQEPAAAGTPRRNPQAGNEAGLAMEPANEQQQAASYELESAWLGPLPSAADFSRVRAANLGLLDDCSWASTSTVQPGPVSSQLLLVRLPEGVQLQPENAVAAAQPGSRKRMHEEAAR